MRKIFSLLLFLCFLFSFTVPVFAEGDNANFDLDAESAILIEAGTGKVLYEKNATKRLPPASVTKIMTILLVMEAIERGEVSISDIVHISPNASSMGGSQVFLKEGEQMTLEELLKCAIIASANDAAVALAEFISGSVESFVKTMNDRATELGMTETFFENVTGLDDTTVNHLTCARDIAIMSRELIRYELVTKYSSMWQDTIRNGEFTLTNTNRLVRYYDGCNGLKTGSTAKAGYCISASAKRNGMQLIAVIMNSPTRDARNAAARKLLDYGFANFSIYEKGEEIIGEVSVYYGREEKITVKSKPFSALVRKSDINKVELELQIPDYVIAPLKSGDVVGRVIFKIGEKQLGEAEIYVLENVEKLDFFDAFLKLLYALIGVK